MDGSGCSFAVVVLPSLGLDMFPLNVFPEMKGQFPALLLMNCDSCIFPVSL